MRGLASVTDPMTRLTSFVRDNRGRAQFITDTANSVTDFDYDFYDNLLTRTGPDPDGNGQLSRPVFRYTYDALDRRTSQSILAMVPLVWSMTQRLTWFRSPIRSVT